MSEDDVLIIKYEKAVFELFKEAGMVLPKNATANIYHHLGIEKLSDTGAMFINVVNRDYCKSYVAMICGQNYPDHFHRIKTESYYVYYGRLQVNIDGKDFLLEPGDSINIERGQSHSFGTEDGCIFEELSTMYVPNDSVYSNEIINRSLYSKRRTIIDQEHWSELREKWNE